MLRCRDAPAQLASFADQKSELDRLRPLSSSALQQMQKPCDIELTYTSNAIEGNTLTLRETAAIIEHGITVGGKHLRDHLKAVDHHDALLWMREQAGAATPLGEATVTELHRRIVPAAVLAVAPFDPATAFEAHFRLTAIHPYADGNGRTARLLMNLMLIRGGYPPVAVRPDDRMTYLGNTAPTRSFLG